MPESPYTLEELLQAVLSNKKYDQVSKSLVNRIAAEEHPKYKDLKTATKKVRMRLHRLTGAFLQPSLGYAQLLDNYKAILESDLGARKSALKQIMRTHASTQERLPFLERFFQETLASIPKPKSILDLACGLNPLAIPFMPFHSTPLYFACDVIEPEIEFLQQWFHFEKIDGIAFLCDLLVEIPQQEADLTLMLKTLPILDQVDPDFSRNLLNHLNSKYILISYPTKSLGGRSKGMAQTYSNSFNELIQEFSFQVQRFDFPNEIAFLLTR